MNSLPPGIILILGPLLLPFFSGKLLIQRAIALALPVLSCWHMASLPDGFVYEMTMFGYEMMPVRVDSLSLVWGYVFHIAALLSVIYALHVKDTMQHVAGVMYAGAAIGAAFAGDLITLFIFWELTAITSVFLIWANRTPTSGKVGTRYLVIQVGSGVILLFGVMLWANDTGSVLFNAFQPAADDPKQLVGMFVDPETMGPNSLAAWLILLAFGIKAAFPFLHNWLQDSYPNATVTGTVFLSAFTTKLAIYALARGFAGTDILIYVGAVMTLFPIFFAVIENDLRKVLAYSLNNQLGYMVVGIGIGTQLALNGTAGHAFAHIIYKGLLFMAMGAVLFRTGTIKANQLGGLYKSMPVTTICCIIGSLSISGFPLFSGFVTKSMTLSAAFNLDVGWLFVALLIASAGVVDHSGIKIPFFAFFAHDNGWKVDPAPKNMQVAMILAAAICIFLGVYPAPLYSLLPFDVNAAYHGGEWHNYSGWHIMTSLNLLLFAALAFALLFRSKLYPPELEKLNLDTDVVYRKWAPAALRRVGASLLELYDIFCTDSKRLIAHIVGRVSRYHAPNSVLGEPWPTGISAIWAAILLAGFLVLGLF